MLHPGDQIAGYRIDGVLGHGGMGIVYEATQLGLKRKVALKVLAPQLGGDESFRDRFRREGEIQAAIDHPNIVTIYEAGESEHGLFLAMRLIRGLTLKDMIIGRELEGARTLRILKEVGDALDSAHDAGLIHRDIKPQNILVAARDHAYLADFGLTKGLNDAGLTRTGQFVGTTDYISPEQIRGERATAASDIYSLAAVLFECLTGVVPYPKNSDAAVLYAHLSDSPPLVTEQRPDLPAGLDDVIIRAMAKDPAVRHASAHELLDDAEHAFGRRIRAVITPPGPIELPEEAGIRDPEHKVPTRETRVRPVPQPTPPPAEPPLEAPVDPAQPPLAPPVDAAASPLAPPVDPAEPPLAPPVDPAEPPLAPPVDPADHETELPAPAPETASRPQPAVSDSTVEIAPEEEEPRSTVTRAVPPAASEPASAPVTVSRAAPAASPSANGVDESDAHEEERPTRLRPRRPDPVPAAPAVAAAATPAAAPAAVAAPPVAHERRAPAPAIVAGVLAVIALGAGVAGYLTGREDEPQAAEPAPLTTAATAGDVELRAPSTWRPAAAPVDIPGLEFSDPATLTPRANGGAALVAGTVDGSGPTLLPAAFLDRLEAPPGAPDRVRLGDFQAYRYTGLRPRGLDGQVTVYVAPTSAGVLAVACRPPSAGGEGFARDCERAATTLKSGGAEPLPLGADERYAAAVSAAVTRLDRARASGRRRLANERTPGRQANAAGALAGAYATAERALRRVRPMPADADAHRALLAAVASTRVGYEQLAEAADRGRRAAYAAASRRVRTGEREIARRLNGFAELGYVVN
jgi:serine/threonine protein kinase